MRGILFHHVRKLALRGSRSHHTCLLRSKRHTVLALLLPSKSLMPSPASLSSAAHAQAPLPLVTASLAWRRHMSTTSAPGSRSRPNREMSRTQTGDPQPSRSSSSMSGEMMAEMPGIDDRARSSKPFSSIPGPRGLYTVPLIGTTLLFKPFSDHTPEKIDKLWAELHEKYGSIIRLRLGKDWLVILEDLSDIEQMLRPTDPTPYRSPIQPDGVYMKREKPGQRTIGNTNGEEWRRLRSPLNTRMNRPSSALPYLPIQETVAVDFAHSLYRLQSESPQVLQELFFRYASESIGVVCFNKRLGFLDTDADPATKEYTEKLLQCYKTAIYSIGQATFGKQWLFLLFRDSFYNKYKETRDYSLRLATQFVEEAMEEAERKQREGTLDPDEPNFLLSLLSEKSLKVEDAVSICDGLLLAGSDSTACGLQLLFHALATHPDKQEKLAAEILGELGSDGSLTAEALGRMTYMKAAVKESLRLHFPIPTGMTRKLPFDITLGGYHIPKGTSIQASSNRVAKSPRYYDKPHTYLPERWLRGEGGHRERTISSLAFLPFGIGSRNCVGQRFAMQEMYLGVVKVLQKYQIGLQDNYGELGTYFTPFCSPDRPLPLTFTPRQ